jgi:hypothetical protein
MTERMGWDRRGLLARRGGDEDAMTRRRERWRWLLRGRLQGAGVALFAFVFWRWALVLGLSLFVLRAVYWGGRRYGRAHRRLEGERAQHEARLDGQIDAEIEAQIDARVEARVAALMGAQQPAARERLNPLSELEAFDRRLRAAMSPDEEATARRRPRGAALAYADG